MNSVENDKKIIVSINSVKNGSTGNIMNNLAREGRRRGFRVYTSCAGNLYLRGLPTECPEFHLYVGGIFENKLHKRLGSIFGGGCYSHLGTWIFLRKLDRIKPDLIHLHNLHSNYINLKMLFRYIRNRKIPVVWTLHDCWAFTGHCPHFDMISCSKWKDLCYKCPQYKEYPEAALDDSRFMYHYKKKAFSGIQNMVLVTPSQWLAGLVKQSFLKDYEVEVIQNGISLSVFRERHGNFREKHGITPGQKMILGVSFSWGIKKGLDVFIELARLLNPDIYQIVLVGTNDEIDRKLPEQIISIHYTENQEELAEIYTAADVFVNPTREDNFPTVNMESLACGTPVVTFRTGGSPEMIDSQCGAAVKKDDLDSLVKAIEQISKTPENNKSCRQKAEQFEIQKKQKEYFELYERILGIDAEHHN